MTRPLEKLGSLFGIEGDAKGPARAPRAGAPAQADGFGDSESLMNVFAGMIEEVVDAVGVAAGALAPEKQVAAIDKMSDKEFTEYLHHIPAGDTEQQLKVLEAMKNNPGRKLAMWAAVHGAEVDRHMDADFNSQGTSEEALDYICRRENQTNSTHTEINDEKKFIEEKMKGMNLSNPDDMKKINAEIDEMIARKEKEHEIERRYNVNLTSDAGGRANGSKVAWTLKELEAVDASLEQMPGQFKKDGQLDLPIGRGSMVTEEFHRGISNARNDNAENWVPTNTHPSRIDVYDNATRDTGNVGQEDGDWHVREKADPEFVKKHGDKVSFLERVLTHEMGHTIEHMNPEAVGVYEELMREKHEEAARHGKDQYCAGEYFAQHVKHAIKTPETFYRDNIERPAKNLAAHEKALAAETDPTRRAELEEAIDDDKFTLENGPKMYETMRNKVMHTDVEQSYQERRLNSYGLPESDMKAFQERAKLCATPEQLKALADKFANYDPNRMKEAAPEPNAPAPGTP